MTPRGIRIRVFCGNEKGYEIWTSVVRPVLLGRGEAYELRDAPSDDR